GVRDGTRPRVGGTLGPDAAFRPALERTCPRVELVAPCQTARRRPRALFLGRHDRGLPKAAACAHGHGGFKASGSLVGRTKAVMRFSVLICTYNRAASLGRTLASLETLEYPAAHEIVVVDNRSADDTERVVRTFADKMSVPVTYLRENRAGKSFAL